MWSYQPLVSLGRREFEEDLVAIRRQIASSVKTKAQFPLGICGVYRHVVLCVLIWSANWRCLRSSSFQSLDNMLVLSRMLIIYYIIVHHF